MPNPRRSFSNSAAENLVVTHFFLVVSAILYFSVVLVWMSLGWLIFDDDYMISVSVRFLRSKLAAILALGVALVYPIYFWAHLKKSVHRLSAVLSDGTNGFFSLRLAVGGTCAETVLQRTIELNAVLTDNLLEEGRALRSNMQRCLDMVETTLPRASEKDLPRCPICLTHYGVEDKVLHVFDCGHHVCNDDIVNCTRNGIVTCPTCRNESFEPPMRVYT